MSPAESVEPAELSPAGTLMHALVAVAGKDAAAAIVEAELAKLTVVERAALSAYWPAWARPSQLPPETAWRSFGFLGARGIGKTRSLAEFVTSEAYEGRAMEIGLAAQKEDDATVQVEALIKASPPWFPATWEPSKLVLVWPNGARARVFTPEVPGSIRGKEFHLVWLSELQSWPVATMEEAMLNFAMATRLGYARTVWDATPKRRHPLLMERLAMHNDDPETHVLRRGSTYENAANLGPGVVAELERKYGGTSRAKEELLGEMIEGEDAALFTQVNLDLHRSECPRLVRKVLGLDPAVTERAGSDRTGIVLAGTGPDERAYVLGDYSGKYSPAAWAAKVLDLHASERLDLVVVETNKGGDLLTQNLRAAARERGLRVELLTAQDKRAPRYDARVLHVREVYSRGAKHDRAAPVATAYERGHVSHAMGARLGALEETLTGWVPTAGARSPDDLDALVIALTELLGLHKDVVRVNSSKGLVEMSRAINQPRDAALPVAGLRHSGHSASNPFNISMNSGRARI
jgi:phage terminase large subunit-like protein